MCVRVGYNLPVYYDATTKNLTFNSRKLPTIIIIIIIIIIDNRQLFTSENDLEIQVPRNAPVVANIVNNLSWLYFV